MKSISKRLDILYNNEKSAGGFKNYSPGDIKRILNHYGNPHKKIRTIHIAGTNGKGSVSYMLNSILIAAGKRTGLYTSPHLIRINERIKINNKDIPNHKLKEYTDELFDVLDADRKLRPTYFDALTVFAFRYFYEEKADIAVIETGLGGRLDSTNIISPEISVITDISLDHKHILGNTIQKIALEKAGIIKAKSIAVTSNRNKSVLDILAKKSSEQSSKLYVFNKDFAAKNIKHIEDKPEDKAATCFDFSLKLKDDAAKNNKKIMQDNYTIKNIGLRIPGEFQIANSSLAIAASLLLKDSGIIVSERDIIKGLRDVKMPGRLQTLLNNPPVVFDPAHNPAAMKATLAALKKIYPGKDYQTIVSFMIDKDYSSMFKILQKELDGKIFYYELDDDRCFKPPEEKLNDKRSIYNNLARANNIEDLSRLVSESLKQDTLLLITGSFRLFKIAQALTKIIKRRRYVERHQ